MPVCGWLSTTERKGKGQDKGKGNRGGKGEDKRWECKRIEETREDGVEEDRRGDGTSGGEIDQSK